jgi:DNA-binding response OmpR family regulator
VKRLVELHDGSVLARSEGLGRGSEFTVRLPLADSPAALPRRRTGDGTGAAPTPRRVLVVDDNTDAAESLALFLQAIGHEATTAADGHAALAAAESSRPDLVLLDIGMPGMNGYDVCRLIRAQTWGRGMTLAALSGWGEDEHKARAGAAGFDHHFIKPVDFDVLRRLLESLPHRGSPKGAN